LARSPANRKKIAVVAGGKRAVTHYRTLTPLDGAALIECRLETGRTHQVRVHLQSLGHPLLGDPAYGRVGAHRALLERLGFARQALHAARLGFVHPVAGKPMWWESAVPPDMQELLTALHG
ncbi:RluA family pseudouridine synthase, partial [Sphingomonas bacterium]|uniref:RluA family pseudouridine synthase n=1 Tax=Sphingomonas bacterium TaxID=1895847 RepID=UPI0020C6F3AE